ncbi:hypothetical protein [Enorma phocaeensis]|uniref:Uncharacterized protein n=1 Tax=Enorma phocaeensis TaxID=1871019 RepID=A0ABT7V8L5_9ACTN|nr:hypothetical protein [Enorma phocaeensis]MDM8274837.1 hypothetical protein [Enorma phocaeensis]
MFKDINLSAVIQSVTDTWLPLMGWLAAAAVVWLVVGTIRRNR